MPSFTVFKIFHEYASSLYCYTITDVNVTTVASYVTILLPYSITITAINYI